MIIRCNIVFKGKLEILNFNKLTLELLNCYLNKLIFVCFQN